MIELKVIILQMKTANKAYSSNLGIVFLLLNKLMIIQKVICQQKIFKVKNYNKILINFLQIKVKFMIVVVDIQESPILLKLKKNKEIMQSYRNWVFLIEISIKNMQIKFVKLIKILLGK